MNQNAIKTLFSLPVPLILILLGLLMLGEEVKIEKADESVQIKKKEFDA